MVWQGISQPGYEQCRLWQTGDGEARLEGTAVLAREGEPFLVRYGVECNAAWETRGVSIELERGAVTDVLTLRADEHQGAAPRSWTAVTTPISAGPPPPTRCRSAASASKWRSARSDPLTDRETC